MQVYDLHCHSHCSDGILSPAELVSRAKAQNVAVLALTDHDTTAGYHEAAVASSSIGLTLIPGIEFSCQWEGRGIHIVGLNFDPQSEHIIDAVETQARARQERAETIAYRLFKSGIKGALEGAQRYANGGSIGRPHFAKYLIEQGLVSNMNQAFKKYLGAGKPGDVKQVWPGIDTAVRWIKQAGGTAVIAHPAKYNMTRTKLCSMVEFFQSAGGQAIEIVCSKQPPPVTSNIFNIAKQYNLLGSCGSDFHIPDQHWQELGQFGRLPSDIVPVWEAW